MRWLVLLAVILPSAALAHECECPAEQIVAVEKAFKAYQKRLVRVNFFYSRPGYFSKDSCKIK